MISFLTKKFREPPSIPPTPSPPSPEFTDVTNRPAIRRETGVGEGAPLPERWGSSGSGSGYQEFNSPLPPALLLRRTPPVREAPGNPPILYVLEEITRNSGNGILKQEEGCPICLEPKLKVPVQVERCGHQFCAECLLKWAKEVTDASFPPCPQCRTPIVRVSTFHE